MQNLLVRSTAMVIQLSGALNAANITTFQHQLSAAIVSEQCSSLLVDMSQVESIDSAGLMALIDALKLAQKLDKQFSLCSVSQPVRMIFELTQLDRVFEILADHPGMETAVA